MVGPVSPRVEIYDTGGLFSINVVEQEKL